MAKCPRCAGGIPTEKTEGSGPGALSRVDDQTEICVECGTDEGLFLTRQPVSALPPLDRPVWFHE